jgi:menaquinone-dependent protoporphyrinogen oxidase
MKSLIIYSTKHGGTAKAAELLRKKLGGETAAINIMKEKALAFDGFDSVMIGGPVYMGSLQKPLAAYITANLDALRGRRTGLFICAAQAKDVACKELETVFPQELRANAAATATFGHELDMKKLGPVEKLMMRAVKGSVDSEFKLDEAAIAGFAEAMLQG